MHSFGVSSASIAKAPRSTVLSFLMDQQKTFEALDQLKLTDYRRFERITEHGAAFIRLCKADNYTGIEQFVTKRHFDLPYLRIYIQQGFQCALLLRFKQTIQVLLQNGMNPQAASDSILTLCYSLEYLAKDPPTDILELLLEYGADPRCCDPKTSDTPMHIAAREGCNQFMVLLAQFGGDINALNDLRETPLKCASLNNKDQAIEWLKSRSATMSL